jgi:cytochrome c-type biogenesis protein CcmH
LKLFKILIAVATLVLSSVIIAAEDNYAFEDSNTRKDFLELTETLRCPMCQNQNIADSDAMIAHDMRRKVYQLLSEGKSKQEVIEFMKARYGDFVHYQPPLTPATSLLWGIPIGFIVIGGCIFIWIRRSSSNNTQANSEPSKKVTLAQAEAMLDQEK